MADVAAGVGRDEWVGRTLANRYRVLRRIGEGGIGAVYLAEHLTLGRHVAVKVLHPHYASTDVLRVRFEREARALSVLSHPNIVTVLDFGREGDAMFLAMELVEGETLAERLRRSPVAPRTALEIMRQILRALAVAHARGIVHRDLKPGNVIARTLPDGSEHVVVLDFGLVKFEEEPETSAVLTRHGAQLGTPAYMAPEQVTGGVANAPADVYAASHIFFELLTGRRVFPHSDGASLLRAHMIEVPPTLLAVRPDLGASPAMEAFLARGLAKRAEERFADAAAMLAAFDALPEVGGVARPSVPHAPPVVAAPPASRSTPLVLNMAPIDPPSGIVSVDPSAMSPSWHGAISSSGASSHGGTTTQGGVTNPGAARKPFPVLPVVAVVAALGIGGAIAAFAIARMAAPQTLAAPRAAVVASPVAPPPTAASARPGAVPARDPWAEPLPPEIAELGARIAAGAQPSRERLKPLYHYTLAHEDDPRAPLLLAHTYVDRGWFEDALEEYHTAHSRDPSVRGDPRMLGDLLRILTHDRFAHRAARYVEQWYGMEALAGVDAAIPTAEANHRASLVHLRERLLAQAGAAR